MRTNLLSVIETLETSLVCTVPRPWRQSGRGAAALASGMTLAEITKADESAKVGDLAAQDQYDAQWRTARIPPASYSSISRPPSSLPYRMPSS